MAQKQCVKCGGCYDADVFFRRNHATHASVACRTRDICIGCEQTARDVEKARDRVAKKVHDTTSRHAKRLGYRPGELADEYGWNLERMKHEMEYQYGNGCPYCGKPFAAMGHGLADITLDIFDPTKRPHYPVNTRWCCMSCNREKQQTPPEEWGEKCACWEKFNRRQALLAEMPLLAMVPMVPIAIQPSLFDEVA